MFLTRDLHKTRLWSSWTVWRCRFGQRWLFRWPSQRCPSTRETCWTLPSNQMRRHYVTEGFTMNTLLQSIISTLQSASQLTAHRKILWRKEDFPAKKTCWTDVFTRYGNKALKFQEIVKMSLADWRFHTKISSEWIQWMLAGLKKTVNFYRRFLREGYFQYFL